VRLLAFPFHDWRKGQAEGFRTRDLHALEWFGRDEHVESIVVVDRPVAIPERIIRRQGWHVDGDAVASGWIGSRQIRLTQVAERIHVLDQATIDVIGPVRHRRGWWFDAFAGESGSAGIAWAARRLGPFDAAIAWLPAVAPALQRSAVPFVFDSLDNWLIHPAFVPWSERSRVAYADILPAARAVFVSGPASRDVLSVWRSDIEIVPNGVDVETFSAPTERPPDLPDGPIVGYVGKLARRIDARLVADVASRIPDVQFVFVGPILEPGAIELMRDIPNVDLLGDRPYESMPAYVRAFDIAWIPHRVGAGETGGDPIKLYEYWAAGKDVISTRIDGVDEWRHQLRLIDSAEDAVTALTSLLDGSITLPPPRVPEDRTLCVPAGVGSRRLRRSWRGGSWKPATTCSKR
jgi:glycosyltransferase involved in cell wall biosynthesis